MSEQQDKEFEGFLSGRSDLNRPYRRLGQETPPPEVDARILAAAREAAHRRRDELGPRGGWLKPVALAATVLLSLSVVMNIVIDSQSTLDSVSDIAPTTMPEAQRRDQPLLEMRRPSETEPVMAERPADVEAPLMNMFDSTETGMTAKRGESLSTDAGRSVELAPVEVFASVVPVLPATALDIVTRYIDMPRQPDQQEETSLASGEAPATLTRVPSTTSADALPDSPPDPEVLLRAIEALRVSGDEQQALLKLADFVERYPDHPVSVMILQTGTE